MENLFIERAASIALNRAFGFEPEISKSLIGTFGSAAAVFALGKEELQGLFGPHSKLRGRLRAEMLEEAEEELLRLEGQGVQYVSIGEAAYPRLLAECPDAPVGLYVRSCSEPSLVFGRDNIAVVGTRDISPYGAEWCERIVRSMAASESKPLIVSGLAIGVDIRAHISALDCGLPTIAVMATGIDDIYPFRHQSTAMRIASTPGCALVTDYPPGTAPLAINFLRRNRIIAGLSRAAILVESKLKGGGTMTARLAASYGRELFCLPGRADDIKSAGCNLLIRENLAGIIDSASSLCEQLGLGASRRRKTVPLLQMLKSLHPEAGEGSTLVRLASLVAKKRGISIEEASVALGLRYEETMAAAGVLQNDALIDIDLLQRCSICPKVL